MPKFYLNLHDAGDLIEDIEGLDFVDLAAAVAEAEASARDMLAARVRTGERIGGQHIDIVREDGVVAVTVRIRDQLNLNDE